MLTNPLPGSPARHVLMQNGLGDAEVPNLGTFLEARLFGIPEVSPNAYPILPLVPQAPSPVQGSALTLWDFGVNLQGAYGLAEPGGHQRQSRSRGRARAALGARADRTLQPNGPIINPCDGGPCYATDGGLDENLPDAGPTDAGPPDAGIDAGMNSRPDAG